MNRSIGCMPAARCYAPQCSPNEQEEIVSLLPEELAVLDLVDLQGLEQEQAAAALGVSRKTVWRDIHEAHRKVADALLHGKALEIGGCLRRQNGICPKMAGITGITPAQSTDDRSPDNSGPE